MKNIIKLTLSCLVLAPIANMSTYAKDPVLFSDVVAKEYEGDLPLQVIVSQVEIKSDINSVFHSSTSGLLGSIVSGAIDKSKAKKAELAIEPIKNSIIDFDGDDMSLKSSREVFLNYFNIKPDKKIAFSKDESRTGKSIFLDNVKGPHATFVEYTYDFSPEFDAVRLATYIHVAPTAYKEGSNPEKRLKPKRLLYGSNVIVSVKLESPMEEKEDNIRLWSANNGELTRLALQMVFDKATELSIRTLDLNKKMAKELKSKDRKKIKMNFGKFKVKGREQDDVSDGQLMWFDNDYSKGYMYETIIKN